MVYVQTRINPREWDTKNSLGFWDIKGLPNPDQKTRQPNVNKHQQKNNRISYPVDFVGPANHRVKN